MSCTRIKPIQEWAPKNSFPYGESQPQLAGVNLDSGHSPAPLDKQTLHAFMASSSGSDDSGSVFGTVPGIKLCHVTIKKHV